MLMAETAAQVTAETDGRKFCWSEWVGGGEWVGEWVGGGRGRDGWAGAGCVAFCCMNGRGGEGSG